ncbi:MAG: FHA domain-containing protein [Ruminococcaceae bacterium]|nr:FHA domain-containing protein [Oscillospiraceae bacterium]
MAIQQCPNGHMYDDEKSANCPFCNGVGVANATVPLGQSFDGSSNDFPSTLPLGGNDGYVNPNPPVTDANVDFPKTKPIEGEHAITVYLDATPSGNKPVRGWLVCVEGKNSGGDYKLYSDKNTVGRGEKNDIKLDFDDKLSRGVAAIVNYDAKNNKFYIYGGDARSNIYVNGNPVMSPIELKDYDVIELGSTKLILRTLCNKSFSWESYGKDDKKAE